MILDALVIGGGPAGTTAAAMLAAHGWRVALAEKAAFPRRKVCGEYISGGTWPILDELGVGAALRERAGPPVTRVGLFARGVSVDAQMPGAGPIEPHGRAIGREILDVALLGAARDRGVEIVQPCAVESLRRDDDVQVALLDDEARRELRARIVIDAHGSWERGPGSSRVPTRASDLLGFKARFSGASLPSGLMPLVLFPGGYGGLVHTDSGEVSFSCCIRRDALAQAREQHRGAAGEAVMTHASLHCRALRETLGGARREGPWLSAGPIRPGIRRIAGDRVFHAGNAAGEAHPLVAEGISMAIQSGWLLARILGSPRTDLDEAARRYTRAWQAAFASRVRASCVFASLTVPSAPARASIAVLRALPSVLTLGARWSGKARTLEPRAA